MAKTNWGTLYANAWAPAPAVRHSAANAVGERNLKRLVSVSSHADFAVAPTPAFGHPFPREREFPRSGTACRIRKVNHTRIPLG